MKGFTKLSTILSPQKLVSTLNEMFGKFDRYFVVVCLLFVVYCLCIPIAAAAVTSGFALVKFKRVIIERRVNSPVLSRVRNHAVFP